MLCVLKHAFKVQEYHLTIISDYLLHPTLLCGTIERAKTIFYGSSPFWGRNVCYEFNS